MELELKRSLTNEDLVDLLSTALEGGIGYWACLEYNDTDYAEAKKRVFAKNPNACLEDVFVDMLLNGKCLEFTDEEEEGVEDLNGNMGLEGDTWKLTLESLKKGLELAFFKGYNIDVNTMDSCDADNIIQLCIFGEVIFG